MTNSPKTAADFAAMVGEARRNGEAPIHRHVESIHAEEGKRGFHIVGASIDGKVRPLSTWQPTEEQAVHCAIARAFC